ncbi:uncharacterized protein IUM83_10691 [Phytophthora cinnamomi]|uniref:uncharacterized protein n=1 Tax=Phytophthora cinnamomi TaxID=4785 RepID=UPI003559BDC5|nr:hypothetical protein IUM83_10691 [Phytophthora cinnamomi]
MTIPDSWTFVVGWCGKSSMFVETRVGYMWYLETVRLQRGWCWKQVYRRLEGTFCDESSSTTLRRLDLRTQ